MIRSNRKSGPKQRLKKEENPWNKSWRENRNQSDVLKGMRKHW
jgi:hypothetical protein